MSVMVNPFVFAGGGGGGGSITLVGETSVARPFGGGTINTSLPGGTTTGDIVIVAIVCDNSAPPITTSGYTAIYNGADAKVSYKIMGGTPDTVVSTTSGGEEAPIIIQVWRGVDGATPIDATATSTTGASGMPDPPSYTTVTNNALVIAVGLLDDDDTTVSAAPTGYTNLIHQNSGQASTTLGSTAMMASKTLATAGAEDPSAFTGGGNDTWVAVTFGLRPA